MGISITRDSLYKKVERQMRKQQSTTHEAILEVPIFQDDSAVPSLSTLSAGNSNSNDDPDVSESIHSNAKAGRPNGCTVQKNREDTKKFKECLNKIAHAYDNKFKEKQSQRKRVARVFLEQVI